MQCAALRLGTTDQGSGSFESDVALAYTSACLRISRMHLILIVFGNGDRHPRPLRRFIVVKTATASSSTATSRAVARIATASRSRCPRSLPFPRPSCHPRRTVTARIPRAIRRSGRVPVASRAARPPEGLMTSPSARVTAIASVFSKTSCARRNSSWASCARNTTTANPSGWAIERNYQKYLDRVQRLKEEVGRSEGNVDSLKKRARIREVNDERFAGLDLLASAVVVLEDNGHCCFMNLAADTTA